MKYITVLASLFLLAACAPQKDTSLMRPVQGNNLVVSTYHKDTSYTVTVDKVALPWAGPLEGGEEKWDARKKAMTEVAGPEMLKACNGHAYKLDGDPYYTMTDKDYDRTAGQYGAIGSLVGSALAAYNADPKRVPVLGTYKFTCEGGGT